MNQTSIAPTVDRRAKRRTQMPISPDSRKLDHADCCQVGKYWNRRRPNRCSRGIGCGSHPNCLKNYLIVAEDNSLCMTRVVPWFSLSMWVCTEPVPSAYQ